MKSHVSLEQHVCPACGRAFDTGTVLLDTRLRQSMDARTVTGYALCPEHQKLVNDGYFILIEVDPSKSGFPGPDGILHTDKAYRTGTMAYIRRVVAQQLFDVPFPETSHFAYTEPRVMAGIQKLMEQAHD